MFSTGFDVLTTNISPLDPVCLRENADPPPERYWELLAEERRLALQEALEENERLHKELEEMKEKNKALEEIAGQAEYFASLYQMVMEGEVPEEQSSDEDDKPEL